MEEKNPDIITEDLDEATTEKDNAADTADEILQVDEGETEGEQVKKKDYSPVIMKGLLLIYLIYSISECYQNLLPGEKVPAVVYICMILAVLFVGLIVKDIAELRKKK